MRCALPMCRSCAAQASWQLTHVAITTGPGSFDFEPRLSVTDPYPQMLQQNSGILTGPRSSLVSQIVFLVSIEMVRVKTRGLWMQKEEEDRELGSPQEFWLLAVSLELL